MIELWVSTTITFNPAAPASRWINIVGRVRPHEGSSSSRLTATFPDGHREDVALGPTATRLVSPGEFNIEVDPREVPETGGVVTLTHSTVPAHQRLVRLIPDETAHASSIEPVVVDGLWRREGHEFRTGLIGYDRLLAWGHTGLTHYRARAAITIHRFATDHPEYPDIGPGAGFVLRWNGHDAVDAEKPRLEWRPVGAICWYRFGRDAADEVRDFRLQILGGRRKADTRSEPIAEDTSGRQLTAGVPYIFEAEVDGRAHTPAWYRFRVYSPESATSDDTRDAWDLEGSGLAGERSAGSLLVVAHHADISVGEVSITELRE